MIGYKTMNKPNENYGYYSNKDLKRDLENPKVDVDSSMFSENTTMTKFLRYFFID